MTTSLDVVNQALQMIDSQTQILSFADVPVGVAAAVVYLPTVRLLLRQNDPDFARFTIALTAVPSTISPALGFTNAYLYPTDCMRLRQVKPGGPFYDKFDPPVMLWAVGMQWNTGNVPTKIISTYGIQGAEAVYTSSGVPEDIWDSIFLQAVVRQLANPLAMAIAGRPDFAKELLQEAAQYEQIAEMVDESMSRSV